jgi:hypothetical protein
MTRYIQRALLLGILIAVAITNGCGGTTYRVGQQMFTVREEAEREQVRQINTIISSISATGSPVIGNALVALPTLEHIEQHGIKILGPKASTSRDSIEYIKRTVMNSREFMFNAIEHRKIFDKVKLTHNYDPQTTPIGDYDFLIYLHNPDPSSEQWYIKAKGNGDDQPITMDKSKPNGLPRTISWLDSLEYIVRSNRTRPTVSQVISDIDELPLMRIKPNKNAYAIVIGIENYRQKLPKADFAVADAETMTKYLTKVMGYLEENIVTLLNERALKSDFEKYFEKWLPNNVEKDSSVFVYYSGHGTSNIITGDAYLVPYNGEPSFIDQTGYSLKRMYDALGKLPAKEIVVALDSCFSGAGGRSVLAKGARPLVMNLQSNIVLSKNMTVISAATGEQISSTYNEKGHGLFTYFMLKGIKNEDVVRPDGSIKMDDLFGYLKPQVEHIARKKYNNEQTPQLIGAKNN